MLNKSASGVLEAACLSTYLCSPRAVHWQRRLWTDPSNQMDWKRVLKIKKKDWKIISPWVQTIWIVETWIFLVSGGVLTRTLNGPSRTSRVKATRLKVLILVLSSYVRTNIGHRYRLTIRNGSVIKGSNTAMFQFISLGQPHWLSFIHLSPLRIHCRSPVFCIGVSVNK